MDQFLFDSIHHYAGQYRLLDLAAIFSAQYLAYITLIAVAFFILWKQSWRRQWQHFFLVALSLLVARGLATEVIRFFYHRPRPFVALGFEPLITGDSSFSFPSGHAAVFFALAMAVFFFNKKWGWYLFAIAIVMGLARVFVGVHWPSDILGGAAIGALSAFLVWKLLPKV